MGSSELDIDDIILRGGDYKYTYICDYDNSDYGYDKELGKWFAWATFEMEDIAGRNSDYTPEKGVVRW